MKFGTQKRNREFFTLPEVLVVLVIMLVLALIAVPIIRKTRVNAWLASCMNNLRTLATASGHYQIDYRQYPPQPFKNANRLPGTMAEYIENRDVFACPVDETPSKDVGIIDSYSDFYVTRSSMADGDSLMAGCPRHDNQTIAINVFKRGNATRNQLGQLHHSQGENLDRQFSGDIVGTGTTWFPDGSSMTIQTPGLEAEIVESFRLDSGQTYTLIKVPANDAFGRLILDVIPGSKFEVITPAAIAGVRGTVFIVDIIADKQGKKAADVFVYEGSVAVTESTGKGERLASWGLPIRCEQQKRPFRSPKTPPALPGLITRPGEQPVIERGNPPWAMGPSPWADGKAPWARVPEGEENVEINNGDREDNVELAKNGNGGANNQLNGNNQEGNSNNQEGNSNNQEGNSNTQESANNQEADATAAKAAAEARQAELEAQRKAAEERTAADATAAKAAAEARQAELEAQRKAAEERTAADATAAKAAAEALRMAAEVQVAADASAAKAAADAQQAELEAQRMAAEEHAAATASAAKAAAEALRMATEVQAAADASAAKAAADAQQAELEAQRMAAEEHAAATASAAKAAADAQQAELEAQRMAAEVQAAADASAAKAAADAQQAELEARRMAAEEHAAATASAAKAAEEAQQADNSNYDIAGNSDRDGTYGGTLTDAEIVDAVQHGAYQPYFPSAWVRWGLWGLILQLLRLIVGL